MLFMLLSGNFMFSFQLHFSSFFFFVPKKKKVCFFINENLAHHFSFCFHFWILVQNHQLCCSPGLFYLLSMLVTRLNSYFHLRASINRIVITHAARLFSILLLFLWKQFISLLIFCYNSDNRISFQFINFEAEQLTLL